MDDDALRRMAQDHVLAVHDIGTRLREVAVRVGARDPDLGEALDLLALALMRNGDVLYGATTTLRKKRLMPAFRER